MIKHIVLYASLVLSLANSQAAVNLLRNPGFEIQGSSSGRAYYWEWNNPDQNGNYWGSASRENWRCFSGSWEGTIRGTWAGQGDEGGYWQQAPAVPGKRYRFSAWFWADPTGDNSWYAEEQGMKIEFYNSSGNEIAEAVHKFDDVSLHWVRKAVEAVAPANAATVRAVIYAWGVGSNAALQFDDLLMCEVEDSPGNPGPSTRRTGLVISEIMYNPPDRTDAMDLEFIELFNTTPFTNDLSGYQLIGDTSYTFPQGLKLAPFSHLVVAREPASVQYVHGISNVLGPYSANLPNGDGEIRLLNDQGAVLLDLAYSDESPWPLAADGAGHSLVLSKSSYGEADHRAWSAGAVAGGSPGAAENAPGNVLTNVAINEFLVHTDEPLWDFIELYNRSAQAIDIGGCALSDSVSTNKFTIPPGTIIPARGFSVFFEGLAATNLPFGLSAAGENIIFRAPDGTVLDAIRFGAQENGVSSGRHPDGAPGFHELSARSAGASNAGFRIRPVVINEIMYNPISDNSDDEYVELHNWSGQSVDVGNWRLTDGVTYTIPIGTTIPANGYLVIARNAARLMSNYPGILNSGNTVGNYSGSLANSGERVVLAKPGDPGLPDQDFVTVDEVEYCDGGHWGKWSDGGGSSLELIDPRSDNRLAPNWADSDETAKGEWTLIEHTGVLDNGMLPSGVSIDQLHLVMLRTGECLVDNVEAFQDSQGNRISNSTFESGVFGWTFDGNHVKSQWASEGYSSTRSLLVRASGGGDTGVNRVMTGLSSSFSVGSTVTLRARVKWLRGNVYMLMRLRGNHLEAEARPDIPTNLGTPGAQNSRRVVNAGPAIYDVSHAPLLPAENESVTVSARVHDPDGIDYVQLKYRLDPSTTTTTVAMAHAGSGVYTATIPGQARGQLAAFHIQARDGNVGPTITRYPDDAPMRECLVKFGEPQPFHDLGVYRFWLTQANMDEWNSRPKQSDEYLGATFVYDNERVIYNAGIRWRGSPFVRPHLVSPESYEDRGAYRVKFPDDEPFLSSTELNLDSLEQYKDSTLQRERACFAMAEKLGLPVSYQRYVSLYINGVHHPYAYADTHHAEGDYLAKWFDGEDDGELFKIDDWFEFSHFGVSGFASADADLSMHTTSGGQKKKARYRWNWEKKANSGFDDDYSGIFRLVDAAHETDSQYTPSLQAVSDMRQWMKVFAFRHVIGDWDGVGYRRGKNGFMYRPESGRWNMILWDVDYALGAHIDDTNKGDDPWHDLFDVQNMPVIKRMIDHPPFRRYYWQTIMETAGLMTSSQLDPVLDEVATALVANGIHADSPDEIKWWVSERRNYILGQLYNMTNVSFAITSNGGSGFSTNRNVVSLSGTAPIQLDTLLINGTAFEPTWTSTTAWTVTLVLTSGVNNIVATGLDPNGSPIPGSPSINITYTGADASPVDAVVINEIMYNPADPMAEFLELHNKSTNCAFDLAGYEVSGLNYTFGRSAVIEPGGYLLLVESLPGFAAAHTNIAAVADSYSGKLDNSGERVSLLKIDGVETVVVDRVAYEAVPPWPTAANGTGPSLQLIDVRQDRDCVANWGVDMDGLHTPGAPNSIAGQLPIIPLVRINEIQTTNATGIQDNFGQREPWLELYNGESSIVPLAGFYLSDSCDRLTASGFPGDSYVPAQGFRVVWMDGHTVQTAGIDYHASFRLSVSTGMVLLVYSNAGQIMVIDYVNYPALPADYSFGSMPDGGEDCVILDLSTPGEPNELPTTLGMSELLLPRYIQGEVIGGENLNRVPYAFRMRFQGLLPSAAYRYANSAVLDSDSSTSDGSGNMIFVKTNGASFIRTTSSPRFRPTDLDTRHGIFHTDHLGRYEGWFMLEPTGNDRFTPGNAVRMRIMLNDGADGTNIVHYLTSTSSVTVIAMGSGPSDATAIVGYSHAGPRQFVAVYDEVGAARPIAASVVHDAGFVTDYKYADFYTNRVAGRSGRWGAIIPNTLPTGIRQVGERSLAEGVVLGTIIPGGGWCVNPSGGYEPALLNAPPYLSPLQDLSIGPGGHLMLTLSASDPDAPPQVLSYSMVDGPNGAAVDTGTGVFAWLPGFDFADTTNMITLKVSDNGSPVLSYSRTFAVRIGDASSSLAAELAPHASDDGFTLMWNAEPGATYRIQHSSSLRGSPWLALGQDVTLQDSHGEKEDTTAADATQRFYRIIRLLP